MSFTFGPNRDSGSVRRNRNPDTRRRPADWQRARGDGEHRKAVRAMRAAIRELPEPVIEDPIEPWEYVEPYFQDEWCVTCRDFH